MGILLVIYIVQVRSGGASVNNNFDEYVKTNVALCWWLILHRIAARCGVNSGSITHYIAYQSKT